MSHRSIAATKTGQQRLGNRNCIRPWEFLDCDYEDAAENRAHLGTATEAQTGSLLFRGLAIRPPAEYHSAKQQNASLRYKPASIRIGASAKMRPRKSAQFEQTLTEPDTDPRPR